MPSFTKMSTPHPRCDAGRYWWIAEKPGIRCRVFGSKLHFLDQTDVDLIQLKPLLELVGFGKKPICIPLEDAEG